MTGVLPIHPGHGDVEQESGTQGTPPHLLIPGDGIIILGMKVTSACIRCPPTHTHTQPQPPGPSHPNSEDSHPISPFYPQQLGSKLHLLLQPFVCGELPETRWRRLLGRVPRSGRRFSLENLSSHVRPGEVQAQSAASMPGLAGSGLSL